MSWISDDYICENQACSEYNKSVEHFDRRENRDTYKCAGYIFLTKEEVGRIVEGDCVVSPHTCNSLLKRQVSAPRTKHISWSLWSV